MPIGPDGLSDLALVVIVKADDDGRRVASDRSQGG